MKNSVYFMRHLPTKSNLCGKICGQSIYEPIVAVTNIIAPLKFDAILCSSAVRCRQTVEMLEHFSGINTKISFTSDLLERNMGNLEGECREDMIRMYPHLFSGNKFIVTSCPPCGESFACFYYRVNKFYNLNIKGQTGNLLICSHNQTLKMLYFIMLGIEITDQKWESLNFIGGTIKKIG